MFTPIRYNDGKLTKVPVASGVAVVKGKALNDENDDGIYDLATSSAAEVPYVAMETVTTTVSGQMVLAIRTENVEFEADVANNTAATDRNLSADLTDAATVNNAASSNDVFLIKELVGAASNKKVIGVFIWPKATA